VDDRELLDKLVGSWRITGTLRGKPLAQAATARRVLDDRFVELRVTDGTPLVDGKPYEAIYLIGVTGDNSSYVMLLADVFGAAYAAVPGIGRREGDALVFEFRYATGPWTWRWTSSADGWDHVQTFLEDGKLEVFATKRMERA
jgi:hypothetical protein